MRTVILDGRAGLQGDAALREKLARHLLARLDEYREEGIDARPDGPGTVLARFAGRTGEQIRRGLEGAGVSVLTAGDGVRFLIGPDVTFEDLDYVQSVAAGLLDGV